MEFYLDGRKYEIMTFSWTGWGHCGKQNKPDLERKSIACFISYAEPWLKIVYVCERVCVYNMNLELEHEKKEWLVQTQEETKIKILCEN